MKITLGHSPDPDDAFMFYAIQKKLVDTGDYQFEHVIQDIQTLNERAFRQELDITALSLHAYTALSDQYEIMYCGASVGDGYGPIVVSRLDTDDQSIRGKRVAIPGEWTTAFMVLKLFEPDFEYISIPFDQILTFVESGQADFGLVIHEGQVTYSKYKLSRVVDLGHWWKTKENLPLPLGLNAIRKDIPLNQKSEIQEILRKSIEYGLEHRKEALDYAMEFGRGINEGTANQFVAMYVNQFTLDLSDEGVEAVKRLVLRAHEAKIISNLTDISFVPTLNSELV